jgi:hypothetical protein
LISLVEGHYGEKTIARWGGLLQHVRRSPPQRAIQK